MKTATSVLWNGVMILSFLLLSIVIASAQGQTVKGRIVDQESRRPIPLANVLVLDTDPPLGTSTDEEGYFRLEGVPLGRQSLLISRLGYEEAMVQELVVGAGKELDLTIPLTETLIKLDEVVVSAGRLNGTPNNEMASVSAQSFSVEQTKRYAASVSDPARMALSFAGVSSNDDGGNEIIIRGNNPRGLLWRMEGIEIPNPNHFAEEGASGGGVSALSANLLANSDFFTGAFPAEYGNALSGVFDLRLRNGNNEKREYALQAGFLGLDLAAEGPLGKAGGASYLANYRYSTLSIIEKLGIPFEEGASTNFQDATFKIHAPTKGGGHLSFWGMGGLSSQVFQAEGDPESFDYFSDRGVLGLNYQHRLSEDAYLETILSFAATRQGVDYRDTADHYTFTDSYTNRALRAKVQYNRKISAQHTLQVGAIGQQLGYELFQSSDDDGKYEVGVDQSGGTYLLEAYAQWKYRLRHNLTLLTGVHATYFGLEGQHALEPRLGLRWNYAPGRSLSLGAGLHSRLEPLSVYLARVPAGDEFSQANRDLPLTQAAHLVLGHGWRFHDNWRLQTEVYYQHLYRVPIGVAGTTDPFLLSGSWLNAGDGFVTDSLVGEGMGRNYGLELTVERFFNGGWYALSTTSLFRSLYTPRDGLERRTRYDNGFVQNLLAGKEWAVGRKRANAIGFNLRLIYAGGNRYTPIDLERSREAGETKRDYSRAFADQLPPYFRLDTGLSFRKNGKRTTTTYSLDIQNTTNRLNAYERYYDADTGRIATSEQVGLIPVFNYRLEF